MKAQELRINNWVIDKLYEKPIQFKSFYGLVNVENKPEQFEPIPLTPEILEKCGFVEKLNRQWSFGENPITHDYMITVRYSKIIDGFYYQNAHFRLRHLHQLQNLFYSLCGEELVVNL